MDRGPKDFRKPKRDTNGHGSGTNRMTRKPVLGDKPKAGFFIDLDILD